MKWRNFTQKVTLLAMLLGVAWGYWAGARASVAPTWERAIGLLAVFLVPGVLMTWIEHSAVLPKE